MSTLRPVPRKKALPQTRHIVVLMAVPGVVAAMTALLYLLPPIPYFSFLAPEWYAIVGGWIITLIIWLILVLFLSPFTTFEHADVYQYDLLVSRLHVLESHLEDLEQKLDREMRAPHSAPPSMEEIGGFRVAKSYAKYIRERLDDAPPDRRWILGGGYLSVWRMFHRAEEALMETETPNALFREALRDKLRIQETPLSNREELLQNLAQAVKTLAPATIPYFEEKEPLAAGSQDKAYDKQTISIASIVLREIRRSFNEFRDNRWQALLDLRDQLLRQLVFIEICTYILLCLVILSGVNKAVLLTALAFYAVGAIAGLFVRFYSESRINSIINVFGLSTVRLVVLPLESGLAAIGGVLLVTVLLATFTMPGKSLSALFTFAPQLWLVAVFFGIIPNLIINGFQKRGDAFARGLQSSKEVTEADEIEPSFLATIDRQLDQIYKYNVNQVRRWSGLSIVAAVLGLLIIFSGVAVIFIGNTSLGLVILLLGGIPEIGALLAFHQSKIASEQLNQMRSQVQGKTPLEPHAPPLKEQEQTIATASSSSRSEGDNP